MQGLWIPGKLCSNTLGCLQLDTRNILMLLNVQSNSCGEPVIYVPARSAPVLKAFFIFRDSRLPHIYLLDVSFNSKSSWFAGHQLSWFLKLPRYVPSFILVAIFSNKKTLYEPSRVSFLKFNAVTCHPTSDSMVSIRCFQVNLFFV